VWGENEKVVFYDVDDVFVCPSVRERGDDVIEDKSKKGDMCEGGRKEGLEEKDEPASGTCKSSDVYRVDEFGATRRRAIVDVYMVVEAVGGQGCVTVTDQVVCYSLVVL
jgi:hypothetical protein